MEKAEALDFIGLKEPLTEETLLNRYSERLNYYHMLYANAPNKVIEKIQQQNLEKLKLVKRMLLEDIAARKKEFNRRFLEPAVQPAPAAKEPGKKQVAGWLIVHTENKKAKTFELYEGVNFIGRKRKEEGAGSIVLQDDPFVSRTHAFIKIKRIDDGLQVVLYDGDGSKSSVNGVYLNGSEIRVHQNCSLDDGDTVQIGMTKLVFKTKKVERNLSGEVEEVLQTGFIRTIQVDK